MTNLTLPIFTDAEKARKHLEAIRWPNKQPICPHCGVVNEASLVKGKSHRPGLYQCNACREPFTVTVGTVMEKSHIPLNKWVLGFHLMASSKKGISAHQLHRMLGITYKSAWFMAHRIREAMSPSANAGPLGGEGRIVEADELYLPSAPLERVNEKSVGGKMINRHGRGVANKRPVVALVERGGKVRSIHVKGPLTKAVVDEIIEKHVKKESRLHTDESRLYGNAHKHVAKHETVSHAKGEYARGDVHSNSVEGHFGIFTRGLVGTYQHVSEQHLHRYLAEFDFRMSNRSALGIEDADRAARALHGATGKRLTYRAVSG